MTQLALSVRFGVSYSTIRRVVKEYGIQRERGRSRRLTGEQALEVVRLYTEGYMRQRDIATRFGVSQPTIGRVVREHGVHRGYGGRSGRSRKLTDEQALEIARLYAKGGVTQVVLAARFGVSQPVICNTLYSLGGTKPTKPKRMPKRMPKPSEEKPEPPPPPPPPPPEPTNAPVDSSDPECALTGLALTDMVIRQLMLEKRYRKLFKGQMKRDPFSDCRVWHGYSRTHWNAQYEGCRYELSVLRTVWILKYGTVPDGLYPRNAGPPHCTTGDCVYHQHLALVAGKRL